MDNVLQTALAEAVNSLASFFGTTTESVIAHAPEFLAKYGWYSTLSNLSGDIFATLFIAMLICLLGSLVLMVCEIELKSPFKAIIGLIVVSLVIVIGIKIITCAVAPEIVGAHAVLKLLKNMK